MRRINTKGLPAYIKGFFTILAGIVFIIFPDAVSNVIGVLFAIILIVLGITGAVDYIISIKEFKAAGYGKSVGAEIVLVYSVIVMSLGIIFLIRPDFVLNILALTVGIFFLIDGVVKLREATLVPQFRSFFWWIMLVLSLGIFAAGIACIIDPFSGTRGIIIFSGITFIASGIETVILSLKGK
jgi:uncharacterized membrane protein HdeD (DUF308 family)